MKEKKMEENEGRREENLMKKSEKKSRGPVDNVVIREQIIDGKWSLVDDINIRGIFHIQGNVHVGKWRRIERNEEK